MRQEGDRDDQVFAKPYGRETQRCDLAKVRESCLESGKSVQHGVLARAPDSDLLNKWSNGLGSSILALVDQQVKGRVTGIRCGSLQSVSQQKNQSQINDITLARWIQVLQCLTKRRSSGCFLSNIRTGVGSAFIG
jgi:hypothetical protein